MFEQNEDKYLKFDTYESNEIQKIESDYIDTPNINIFEPNFFFGAKEKEENLPEPYFIMTGRSTQEDDEKCEKICVNENENENNNIPIINSLKGRKKKTRK